MVIMRKCNVQTNEHDRPRSFAHAIDCKSIMETRSRDFYATNERIWWHNHLRHTTTENMTIMEKLIWKLVPSRKIILGDDVHVCQFKILLDCYKYFGDFSAIFFRLCAKGYISNHKSLMWDHQRVYPFTRYGMISPPRWNSHQGSFCACA